MLGRKGTFLSTFRISDGHIISVYLCVINTMNSANENENNYLRLYNILTNILCQYFHQCKTMFDARLYLYSLSIHPANT
jgi:hypothetical protein